MADIKPLGSEKLNGDEKLKRILELTYYNQTNKKSTSTKPELVKESTNGGVYGIVKEKDGYYVKRGLNESSLDYIGGMFMKNKNRFSSYADAFKRLDLLKGQEELQEATKYVLKPSSPKTEAPLDMPADAPTEGPAPAPAPEVGATEPSPEEMPVDSEVPSPEDGEDMGGEDEMSGDSKRSDYMAEVQKYAGKLGQELRDQHQKMESDDIKYVLNMVISACDLDKLEDDDIEDIGKKFDRDEEEGGSEEEVPDEEPTAEPESEPSSDEELGETMNKLNDFINTPMDTSETNLADYADLEEQGDDEYAYASDTDLDEGGIYNHLPGDYSYDPFDMDDKITAKRKSLKKMGHDHETVNHRVHGFLNGKRMGKSDFEKIDMTPPSSHTDDEVEFDLDEIKNEINSHISSTLSKYFK